MLTSSNQKGQTSWNSLIIPFLNSGNVIHDSDTFSLENNAKLPFSQGAAKYKCFVSNVAPPTTHMPELTLMQGTALKGSKFLHILSVAGSLSLHFWLLNFRTTAWRFRNFTNTQSDLVSGTNKCVKLWTTATSRAHQLWATLLSTTALCWRRASKTAPSKENCPLLRRRNQCHHLQPRIILQICRLLMVEISQHFINWVALESHSRLFS